MALKVLPEDSVLEPQRSRFPSVYRPVPPPQKLTAELRGKRRSQRLGNSGACTSRKMSIPSNTSFHRAVLKIEPSGRAVHDIRDRLVSRSMGTTPAGKNGFAVPRFRPYRRPSFHNSG